jgi:hypothetical protein
MEHVDEWSVERHLAGKPDWVLDIYERFIAMVELCGPFSYSVTKSAITLKGTRRGFAGAKPRARWFDGYLDMQVLVKDERILRASPYTQRLFVHQFRITRVEQIDDEFAGWVRAAYEVGNGAHLSTDR